VALGTGSIGRLHNPARPLALIHSPARGPHNAPEARYPGGFPTPCSRLVGLFVLLSCYIIVCNEHAFCFVFFLSYLFPVVLSYASFSSYDTRVACRTCLNMYSSCSPTQRVNTHNYSIRTQLSISTEIGTSLQLEDDRFVPGGRRRINAVTCRFFKFGITRESHLARRCRSQIFVQGERVGSNLNPPIIIVHSTWQIHSA